jgi:hypothetical protein
VSREHPAPDAVPTPEEAAAIAAGDALLDALEARRRLSAEQQQDPAARMLGAWATEMDGTPATPDRVGRAAPVAVASRPSARPRPCVPGTHGGRP